MRTCDICKDVSNPKWKTAEYLCQCGCDSHLAQHPHACRHCDCPGHTLEFVEWINYPCVGHVTETHPQPEGHFWLYDEWRFYCDGYSVPDETVDQSKSELRRLA